MTRANVRNSIHALTDTGHAQNQKALQHSDLRTIRGQKQQQQQKKPTSG